MDIEDYQEKDISGKILYLASLFKGIKDHLKILNEMDELTGVESQMFTILNDLQLGINELCILYEKIEKSPGNYKKTSEKIKLNSLVIYSIEIDSVVYVLKNLEYADGKSYTFCCIKLLEGTQAFGLYQWGAAIDPKKQVVYIVF